MVLHHWKKKQYEAELDKSVLDMNHGIDITKSVIRGFNNYRSWMRNMIKFGFFEDLAFKIFYIINVQWTLYCLRRRREYFIFVGIKPLK